MKTIYSLLIAFLILPATISTISAQSSEKNRSDRVQSERKATTRSASKAENNRKTTTYKKESVKKESNKVAQERKASENDRRATEVNRKSVSERIKIERADKSRSAAANRESNRNDENRDVSGRGGNDTRNDNIDQNRNQNQSETRNNDLNQNRSETRNNDLNQNRNQNDNRDNDINRNRSQNDRRDNEINRNRSSYRIPVYDRSRDNRFRNDNERCRICFGIGYMFSHDRLHRLRCNSCRGRGYASGFGHNMREFCPVCFTNMIFGRVSHMRSIEEIARIETNQLSVMLDLSDHQANKIYRIYLSYLRNRHRDIQYAMQERDKDILDVLNWRQQDMYLNYLNDVDYRDLCDNCFSLRL